MMHERIRKVFPDFSRAALCVLQCGGAKVVPHVFDEIQPLYDAPFLEQRIQLVLDEWYQLQLDELNRRLKRGSR